MNPARATAVLLLVALGACGAPSPKDAPILLFAGAGTSPNDVAAVKAVLINSHLDFASANSAQLNAMSDSALAKVRLLIVPGGNFITIGDSLAENTTVRVHNAVQNGVNYLGLCAGAFVAGKGSTYRSFDLTSGVRFNFYAISASGVRKAPVMVSAVGMPPLDQYWEDGPELSGWGEVVARYPDSTPAVAQGALNKGWVVLTGVHPEAPESWRGGMAFATSVRDDNAYAAILINAALNRTALPHY